MPETTTTDTGTYVRERYGVKAYERGRVIADRKLGMITGFEDGYVLVLLDGDTEPGRWHPTWRMTYLPALTDADREFVASIRSDRDQDYAVDFCVDESDLDRLLALLAHLAGEPSP